MEAGPDSGEEGAENAAIADVVLGKATREEAVAKERAAKIMRLSMMAKLLRTDSEPAEVVPKLFLGSIGAAQNEQRLVALGISHVLCVGRDIAPATSLEQMVVEIQDHSGEALGPHIEPCVQFIRSAMSAGGGTLVHCFAGKSRSTSMVIAYLMVAERMEYIAAFDLVRSKRPSVNPNPGFCTQLRDLGLCSTDLSPTSGAKPGTALRSVSDRLLCMIRGCGAGSVKVAQEPGKFVVVHQKFGVSALHLTVVLDEPVQSLQHLGSQHCQLLREGWHCALRLIQDRIGAEEAECRSGFIFPQAVPQVALRRVSFELVVFQVQLHVIAPPFKHETLFAPPRWHWLDAVLSSLEGHGSVDLNDGGACTSVSNDDGEKSDVLLSNVNINDGIK